MFRQHDKAQKNSVGGGSKAEESKSLLVERSSKSGGRVSLGGVTDAPTTSQNKQAPSVGAPGLNVPETANAQKHRRASQRPLKQRSVPAKADAPKGKATVICPKRAAGHNCDNWCHDKCEVPNTKLALGSGPPINITANTLVPGETFSKRRPVQQGRRECKRCRAYPCTCTDDCLWCEQRPCVCWLCNSCNRNGRKANCHSCRRERKRREEQAAQPAPEMRRAGDVSDQLVKTPGGNAGGCTANISGVSAGVQTGLSDPLASAESGPQLDSTRGGGLPQLRTNSLPILPSSRVLPDGAPQRDSASLQLQFAADVQSVSQPSSRNTPLLTGALRSDNGTATGRVDVKTLSKMLWSTTPRNTGEALWRPTTKHVLPSPQDGMVRQLRFSSLGLVSAPAKILGPSGGVSKETGSGLAMLMYQPRFGPTPVRPLPVPQLPTITYPDSDFSDSDDSDDGEIVTPAVPPAAAKNIAFEEARKPSWIRRKIFGEKTSEYKSGSPINMRIGKLKKKVAFETEEEALPTFDEGLYSYLRANYQLSGYSSYNVKLSHMDKLRQQYYRETEVNKTSLKPEVLAQHEKTVAIVCNMEDMGYLVQEAPLTIDLDPGFFRHLWKILCSFRCFGGGAQKHVVVQGGGTQIVHYSKGGASLSYPLPYSS